MKGEHRLKISGVFPVEYLMIAKEQGVDINHLLSSLGMSPNVNILREHGILFEQMLQMMHALWQVTNHDLSIGFQAGCRITPTAFGYFGQAILSCNTFQEAIVFCTQYWELIGKGIQTTHQENDKEHLIIIETEMPTEGYLQQWMIESAIFSFWRTLVAILPNAKHELKITLTFAEPPHAIDVYKEVGIVKYNYPINSIQIPIQYLSDKLPLRSSSAFAIAIAQCDAQLNFEDQYSILTKKIKNIIGLDKNGYLSLDEMAVYLSMSARTLRRNLADEGSKYSELLKQVKLKDATRLLQNTQLSIDEIASKMGYEDDANFCRAFRKWSGQTPSEVRKIN